MTENAAVKLMTSEELFALPTDDGVERWLIKGELRERPMTRRNPDHSSALVNIGHLLKTWVKSQPAPRGRVYGGEVYCRLTRNPDTNVGIDIAYAAPELATRTQRRAKFVDGAPVLAVEILSPGDTHEEVIEKLDSYLGAGTKLIWVVDPYKLTVTVYCSDVDPQLFSARQEITAEPHLPGLRIRVADVFED